MTESNQASRTPDEILETLKKGLPFERFAHWNGLLVGQETQYDEDGIGFYAPVFYTRVTEAEALAFLKANPVPAV
jgi:hypothetical protein